MGSEQTLLYQLPDYFKPILEFQAILKAHGWLFDNMGTAMQSAENNTHILTCDADTIAYFEDKFGINARLSESLEFRRKRLLQRFNTVVPFTYGFLTRQLNDMYGAGNYELSIDAINCTLSINVITDDEGLRLLYEFLFDVIPAHIEINAMYLYPEECTFYVGGVMDKYAEVFVDYQPMNKDYAADLELHNGTAYLKWIDKMIEMEVA